MAQLKRTLENICASAAPLIAFTGGSTVMMMEGLSEKNPYKISVAVTGYLLGAGYSFIVYRERRREDACVISSPTNCA